MSYLSDEVKQEVKQGIVLNNDTETTFILPFEQYGRQKAIIISFKTKIGELKKDLKELYNIHYLDGEVEDTSKINLEGSILKLWLIGL